MANEKISDMPDADLPLGADDIHTVVQGGVNKQVPNSAVGTLQGFAYDEATSDFAAGIFGLTAGFVNSDFDSPETSPSVIDLSAEENGNYYIYVSANTAVPAFLLDDVTFDLAGGQQLHYVTVTSGVITYDQVEGDLRTWAKVSATLANLAAVAADPDSTDDVVIALVGTLHFEGGLFTGFTPV